MFNVGLFELVFFISFALIFLGPEKLLELLKGSYQFYQKLRHLLQNFQTDVERELKLNALQETLATEIDKVRHLEQMLSQKIQDDLEDNTPIYMSLPYSDLGKIQALYIYHPQQLFCIPMSYSVVNTHLHTHDIVTSH